jgi:hypothetical protein
MRHDLYGGFLLAAAAALAGPAARGQDATPAYLSLAAPPGVVARGQFYEGGTEQVPGRPPIIAPIPTGNPGGNGFFSTLEFIYLSQTFALGNQTVAYRGLIDSSGNLTGAPGTRLGTFNPALTTDQFGRRSYQPGYKVGLGYKFDNGLVVYGTFAQTVRKSYAAGATSATPLSRNTQDLADSYLYSPVFNFPPDYAGPPVKTAFDVNSNAPFGNFYGIWNGATVMDIQFRQTFTYGDMGARVPLLQTEYSRVYGLGGARYAWFAEKFYWRTVGTDLEGVAFPQYVANYRNELSQRMYGPYIGCGHEVYLGKRMAIAADLTGAGLFSIVKERAYYELGDKTTKAKRSRNDFDVVPNANLDIGLMWYPLEGVQVKVAYTLQTFFNTRAMGEPIAFNFGALDPVYDNAQFRYVSGFTVGLGLFF